ncbi:MAG: hypothetical protein ACJ8FI_04555 [Sphingomicrobium sp.]|jgi:hypothetical protein
MLNLIPQPEEEAPTVYAEAVSRLASVRHALRLVDGGFGTGPEDDLDDRVAASWDEAGEAKQRWFERRSGRLVGAAAVGIEALLGQRHQGRETHAAASQTLVEEIRRELRDVAQIVLA